MPISAATLLLPGLNGAGASPAPRDRSTNNPSTPAVAEPASTEPIGGERKLDDQLVARAAQGDRAAFDVLVLRYQHKIVHLTERLVGEADALDVAQESFIKAYRALKNFRGQSAFYTWLYRIALNTAKNFLVARKRRPASRDIDAGDAELYGYTDQMSHSDTPEALALSDEIRDKVSAAIDHLPADLREAITLRELDGLSYEEIAQAMDCPIGTVRSRIFRARAVVDEVLGPLLA
jgi:RNA polymerase sigma-70 factor (ECF subfamily)